MLRLGLLLLHLAYPLAVYASQGMTKAEYHCLLPLELDDFRNHLAAQKPYSAINWNLNALRVSPQIQMRVTQMSIQGMVSPLAALIFSNSRQDVHVSLRARTLELKWLTALYRSDAVDYILPERRLILEINRSYHFFNTDFGEAEREELRDDIHFDVIRNGAYVFSNYKAAFILNRDFSKLILCPRVHHGHVDRTQLASETIRFLSNSMVIKLLLCEALLTGRI
jgi:hypothetical protein